MEGQELPNREGPIQFEGGPGRRLGDFELLREVGRGGMGIVYLGRDTRLARSVAIKLLPEAFARDRERLARFEREARLLASLRHSNIAGIHGLEEAEGLHFLVLEYVEGETLFKRLAGGPLPVDEALDVVRQIASAMEAAHEASVIHRDLKPGNVMITPGGDVKVLDFGLAKGGTATGSGSGPDLSHSPTMTVEGLTQGVILGTAAYMSPEQARGKLVDRRADIWSFGCVLYECLTGFRPFEGETVSDTIAKILEREPDWSRLPERTPVRVRELLRRCLEKDAKRRLRDVGDARVEIEELLAAGISGAGVMAAPGDRPAARRQLVFRIAPLAAALLAGAAIGAALWRWLPPAVETGPGRPVVRLEIDLQAADTTFSMPRMAPDGSRLLFAGQPDYRKRTGKPQIYARRLDGYEISPLPGTEGVLGWTMSRDSRLLYFVTETPQAASGRKLFRMPLDGSAPPIAVTDMNASWRGFTQLPNDDFLVFANGGTGLARLSSSGKPIGPEKKIDAGSYRGFFGLPVGGGGGGAVISDRALLVNATSYDQRGWGVSVGLLDPVTGKASILIEDGGNARYSPTGHLVFARGDLLLAVPFDRQSMRVQGNPFAIESGLRTIDARTPAAFDLTSDGTLIYAPGGRVGEKRQLVLIGRDGTERPWSEDRMLFKDVTVSPDGKKIAAEVVNPRGLDEIWTSKVDEHRLERLVAEEADCSLPMFSQDGERILYRRIARDEKDGFYEVRSDGTAPARKIFPIHLPVEDYSPQSWQRDGSGIIATRTLKGKSDLVLIPLAGGEGGKPRPLVSGSFDVMFGRLSPDGKWIALGLNEAGNRSIYLAPFRPDGSVGKRIPVSKGDGFFPVWSLDGSRLHFGQRSKEGIEIMTVDIVTRPTLSISTPRHLWEVSGATRIGWWGVLPGDVPIGVQNAEAEEFPKSYRVVLNWAGELRRRVAAEQSKAR